jgi:hypothetical protein
VARIADRVVTTAGPIPEPATWFLSGTGARILHFLSHENERIISRPFCRNHLTVARHIVTNPVKNV